MTQSPDSSKLSDGVYMGVNLPFVEGKTVPHPWIEVVRNGTAQTYEYGPQSAVDSPMVEKTSPYDDSHRDAGALYRLEPPPGMSSSAFIDRAEKIGRHLDAYLQNEARSTRSTTDRTPYEPVVGADCDTAAAAAIMNLGGSREQFKAMISESVRGGPLSAVATMAGGATIDVMPGAFSELAQLTSSTWRQVGPAPGIPSPDVGSMQYERLERDTRGHWGPSASPGPEAGHAPALTPDPDDRRLAPPTASPPVRAPLQPSVADVDPRTRTDAATTDVASRPDDVANAPRKATVDDVRREVDALRGASVNLPSPRSLRDWRGQESAGTFVDLGNGQVAQHLGRGDYQLFDVQRDLAGVTPPIGEYATLARDGRIDVPQRDLGLGRSFG